MYKMSRKYNTATLYQEKTTRRGRPYSPYCATPKANSKRSMINNNIDLNECDIDQSHLLAQIFEDAKQSSNRQQQHRHHNQHFNTFCKKVPFHQATTTTTTNQDVPSPNDSETEDSTKVDQYEPSIENNTSKRNNYTLVATNNNNSTRESGEEDDDDDEVEEEAPTPQKTSPPETAESTTTEANGRSDSVIFTGSYTQHDIELEEISRIRTNGKFQLSFSQLLLSQSKLYLYNVTLP